MDTIYIEESQSFGLIGLVTLPVAIIFGVLSFIQIVLKKQVGNHPAPSWLLVVIFIATASFAVVFNMQRLKTTITNQAIKVSFGIFMSPKIFLLSDIKSITMRKYDGMSEFRGWGVKGNANEQSYTVSGDDGIEIELKSGGKKILIGTHEAAQMQEVIGKYLKK